VDRRCVYAQITYVILHRPITEQSHAAARMKQRKRVALLIETSNSYARGLLEGIIAYVREHDSWSVYVPEIRRGDYPPQWLARWRGDGIIARIENREIAKTILRTGLPVVDVSSARVIPDIPWVETNDAAIARTAAEHLLERGFRNLAFCGDPRFNWSKWRWRSFQQIAMEAGAKTWEYRTPRSLSWDREQRGLKNWVLHLPRPVGVMACYDIKGQQLLNACRDLNLAVPEEVAVIGVDNDSLICELCMPRLSSVISDPRRTGYVAAELLDQMIRGKKVPGSAHLIDPLGVCTRQSTDILLIEDHDVVAAIRFIREHACDGIRIGDVLGKVSLSRRMLESRFLKCLGRTPHREIERVRMDCVKRLLRETDLSLNAIARRTGFSSEYYLSVAFKRATKQTPRKYRCETLRRSGKE
jgi:LacI family transcriptional regulator